MQLTGRCHWLRNMRGALSGTCIFRGALDVPFNSNAKNMFWLPSLGTHGNIVVFSGATGQDLQHRFTPCCRINPCPKQRSLLKKADASIFPAGASREAG